MLNLKNDYLTIIYEMTVKKKSVKEIHKALRKLTINENPVLPYMYRVAKQVQNKTPDEILNHYMGGLVFANTTKLINIEVRTRQETIKEKIIDDYTKKKEVKDDNKELKHGYPFFVASQHSDSALDHKDYQGKLYWNELYKDDEEIKKYAYSHHLQSVQWVTSKPVYFITRPYCRHYFKPLNYTQVIKGTYTIPTRKIGSRAFRTPKPNTQLQYYIDRLNLLNAMYRKHPTQTLKLKIQKTKMLISKHKTGSVV